LIFVQVRTIGSGIWFTFEPTTIPARKWNGFDFYAIVVKKTGNINAQIIAGGNGCEAPGLKPTNLYANFAWEECMRRVILPFILTFLITCYAPTFAQQTPEDILKAIVKIRATIPKDAFTAGILGTEREGNGVFIDEDGHILTIGYLILEAETIQVIGAESQPVDATFVAYDFKTGFGILRASLPPPMKPMKLGESSALKQGDPILVAGSGGSEAVQGALVVSRKEFAGYWEYLVENAIYTNPPYPNYGGAALIDRDGRLLGIGSIYTQVMIPKVGLMPCNMSIPVDLLKPILNDLIRSGRSSEPSQPWLGLHADEVHGRIFVLRVTPEGPAEKAGIKTGDIILAVNQNAVRGLADFFRKVWALGQAGVDVPLSILQETKIREIRVKSGDRYQFLKLTQRR
jgi:S1-C subfamily serine protease